MVSEPLFANDEYARLESETAEERQLQIHRRALLKASVLAIQSAYEAGIDMPIAALALRGTMAVGRYVASDKRTGFASLHAEQMAIHEAELYRMFGTPPDWVAVTAEPCDNCQDFLAKRRNITKVVFAVTRQQLADRKLVRPHDENIFTRKEKLGLQYDVIHVDDERISTINGILFDHTNRDTNTGEVSIDRKGLYSKLAMYYDQISAGNQ